MAAISVAAPVWRLTRERADQLGPEIARIGRAVGLQLRGASEREVAGTLNVRAHPAVLDAAFYGSDPVWDPKTGVVRWADRFAPCVHVTGRGSNLVLRPSTDALVTAAALDGTAPVLAVGGRLVRLGPEHGTEEDDGAGLEISALAHGPDERLWAAKPEGCGSRIGRLDGEGTSWTVGAAITALVWSMRDKAFYAADADRGVIYVLKGTSARLLARLPAVSGAPRGLALDAVGRLWTALYDGWSIARLSEEGDVDRVVALPVPRPTGVAFTLDGKAFVTTARVDLPMDVLERAPLSGRLLFLDLEEAGRLASSVITTANA